MFHLGGGNDFVCRPVATKVLPSSAKMSTLVNATRRPILCSLPSMITSVLIFAALMYEQFNSVDTPARSGSLERIAMVPTISTSVAAAPWRVP